MNGRADVVIYGQTSMIEYQIESQRHTEGPVALGSDFHAFSFTVDAAGAGHWSRDGRVVMSKPAFLAADLVLHLHGDSATVRHRIDNVKVTAP
jgi:hypothetical protein